MNLDTIIIICITIGVVYGLITGIIKQVISLVSLIIAILLSGAVASRIRHGMLMHIPNENLWIPSGIQNALFFIIAFILIIAIFTVAAKVIDKIISYTPVGILNRLFGALFGAFIWVLSLSILLNFMVVFDSESRIITKQAKENSVYYERVVMLFPTIFPYINDFLRTQKCPTIIPPKMS